MDDPKSLLDPNARLADVDRPPAGRRGRLLEFTALTSGICVLAISLVVTTCLGAHAGLGWPEVGRVVGFHVGLAVEPLPPLVDALIWDVRIPRVLTAALVGAALAVSGAALQAITRNSLADPYIMGVSAGASTGAVAVVVLGFAGSQLGTTGGAFVGALMSVVLSMLLLRRSTHKAMRIILTGVVVGQLFSALTSLILMASGDADSTRALTHWLLGSMASARWHSVVICLIAFGVVFAVLWSCVPALDCFAFGTDTASSMGINVAATRAVLLISTSLLTAVSVAQVGVIGFVGLIVPHTVRLLLGSLHQVLLPMAAVVGAVFMLWSDALARVVFAPLEVPVGVVTALLGVPQFLLILRSRGER
ncbi:FecCD family ABC transporter permease [Saccharothrix obliqua]|uniref:FecCD family ABC transporter permease n=1 Tax=Saccharothrix obliqua TaxID=2861747 RepID=UPI001C5CFE6C|nr:iron chelate uptake ABC transporter family permease subunit [Saccharothrix obliqua]MBW4718131.1 iron ABC transporter permease [Saccharothrix obliqua]